MSAATAPVPSSSSAPAQNGAAGPSTTTSNGAGESGAAASAAAVAGSSQAPTQPSAGVLSIPPHLMPFLLSMNKEKLTQMITRMKSLQAAGQNEQNNAEYANLMNAFRYFQQMQAWRQQQQQARSSSSPQHANGDAKTPSTSLASLPATVPAPDSAISSAAPVPPVSAAATSNGISAPAANGVDASKPSTDASGMSTTATSTFTSEQLSSLKTQIIAFKLLARNKPIPDHIRSALLNPDKAIDDIKSQLDADAEALGAAGKVAQAGYDSHRAAEAMKDRTGSGQGKATGPGEDIPRPSSPKEDPTISIYPYNAFRHPFTYLSKPSMGPGDFTESKAQRLLVPSLMPAGLDAHMLLQERDRFVNARIQQRIRELESFPSTMSQRPTLKGKEHEQEGKEDFDPFGDALQGQQGDNAKLRALIELKSLQLLPMQRALRESVTKGMAQATTLALDRTAFRRFKKQTLRDARITEQLERKQRVDREKRARQNHVDYLNTICNHGRELMAAHKAHQQNTIQKMGKLVMRLHADVEREEQKRIERIAKERLNALKADDEEAYLKLIDTAKDTRITHLIRQTDAYLDNLAQAVQAQQNDDVHADAIAAERAGIAQPSAEDLAVEKANQEVGVAVDETMFGAQRQDDPNEDKGKVDYYSVAHRITERITAQPGILVGGTLKEYQIKGLQWMVSLYNNRLNGILADEMGLGKTIQTISLITFLIETKKQRGPYLVIVPLSTLTNWVNEFEKWAPSVTTVVYKGVPNVRKNLAHIIRMGNYDCLLTTYEYIIKDKHLLGKIKWTHMIIDEGHRMKNTQSKLTLTLTQHYTSRYRLLLTGTPLQNNLPELWALLNFVLPKIFNSVKSFDEWFNTPFANTGASDGSMQLNEEEALLIIKRLHKVLRPFLLRRLKKDVESELPDKVEKVIKCKMSSLQRKLYQQMKNHKMLLAGDDTAIGGTKSKGIRGLQNAIMQLRKICNHPYVFEQVELAINPTKENGPDLFRVSGKFELLDRILPKLKATGHRVLIFFQMTAIMDIMEDFLRFRGFKYLRLDGGTKPEDRSHLLTAFNAPGSDIDIFILSTRAGGLGLNLQTADTVIIYDSDWNPHQDLQAQDRAHRIGQKMEVRILRLVTSKSVEETILERARGKLEIDGKVIQAGKFDNQATAAEREDLLRAMLEADTEEEDDEEGDFNDDELNQLLARADDELDIFKKLDKDREEKDEAEWRARGWKGKAPERLIQESELPSLYQQDFEAVSVMEDVVEETPVARRRNVVHYDDGLTEEQFLRALEDDDVDIADVVEKKRERAEKRRLKQVQQANQSGDTSEQGTPEPTKKSKHGARGKNSARATETPEAASPAPGGGGGRKRKRHSQFVESPSPEDNDSYGGDSRRGSGGAMGGKRQKKGGDDTRERIHDVLLQCYRAVENCYEEYSDGSPPRKRTDLFMDIPKKSEYPDYHVIIQRPICMRQIRRRIDNRTYRSVSACRDDFALMIANAKTYNQEGSWVYNDAIELMNAFDGMYNAVARNSGLPGADNEGNGTGEEDEQDQDDEEEQPAAPVVQSSSRPKIKLSMKGRGRPKKEEAADDDDDD